jgi:hypothetical protein
MREGEFMSSQCCGVASSEAPAARPRTRARACRRVAKGDEWPRVRRSYKVVVPCCNALQTCIGPGPLLHDVLSIERSYHKQCTLPSIVPNVPLALPTALPSEHRSTSAHSRHSPALPAFIDPDTLIYVIEYFVVGYSKPWPPTTRRQRQQPLGQR